MNKITCVIMDWAGTAIDYGCFAPLNVFLRVFEEKGVHITYLQAREPMGLPKMDHIKAILNMPEVKLKFQMVHGRDWDSNDLSVMYQSFEKYLFSSLRDFTDPIPGVPETMEILRKRGIKIGSTTGYTQKMMDVVRPEAMAKGYVTDNLVTPDGLPAGRPAPYMIYRNMIELAIPSVDQVVKVGDTIADIKEGVNAKAHTVGVIIGSNEMGLTESDFNLLSSDRKKSLMEEVRNRMLRAGAHGVIDTISELPDYIDQLSDGKSTGNYLLLTPGPLSTARTVREAMLQDWCTWDKDYNEEIVTPIRQKLLELARVDAREYTTILLQGSGTYCVEASIGSTVKPSDKLLIVSNGAYGQRIGTIASYYRLNYEMISISETEPVTGEIVREALEAHKDVTHVAMVHCETTTGILNRLEEVGEVVKEYPVTFIVDAMSSFGGIPIDMKACGIDVLVSSANKCIQGVPGFGFILVSKDKLPACKGNARSLSLDVYDQWETMEKGNGKWRFTSPTHVVRAFHQALVDLEREGGVEARYKRYRENNAVLYEGMKTLGFTPLLPRETQSPIITSFLYPSANFDFQGFYDSLKQKGFVIYPGKISDADTFRIGNIGDVNPDDMGRLLYAIHETPY
ncbi:MAG: 2-aminoethylphosphonate--pyruvate transaminase [Mediterranea sp.]|jgi:2-aminoethylphosphonate--pyruvate transaminase/phosphonoacetaldehyde hydrolase|nr:2-aminoethylphosphonate--pyruvate transaminase [Mediterranea sp.]